ncbi:SpoIIE family protein phosphatase [Streptomyces sp. HUAS ZL42]|uniref:SpoIIE family protein phosphatase n=1 Tax=Streptomyces sp. HUAS ZL42 TaxID=3231715 RepID=UPI00345F06CC
MERPRVFFAGEQLSVAHGWIQGALESALDVPPGPLFGIGPDAVHPVTEVPLTHGLMLVLCADGLVERPGVNLYDSVAALAHFLAHAEDGDLKTLIDMLVGKAGTSRQRTYDIALLVLHHAAHRLLSSPPESADWGLPTTLVGSRLGGG